MGKQVGRVGHSATRSLVGVVTATRPTSWELVKPGRDTLVGLSDTWAIDAIRKVGNFGNYGEIYARNIGPKTQFKLERGITEL